MTGWHRAAARRGAHLPRHASVLVGAMLTAILLTLGYRDPSVPRTVGAAGPPAQPGPSWVNPTAAPLPVAKPVRLLIPAIGVDSPIVEIGVAAAGTLEPPATADLVGWFTGGPAPGDTGPALLAAHVDSRVGPGVFFRLVDLRPGDRITVERADRTSVSFTVASTAQVAKADFPTELVYAPLPVPMLRLITCGGTFDRAAHSYRDNVIIHASPS